MQQDFWLNCWRQNQLGWQQDAAHPLLIQAPADWLDQRPVFVPLCGKSPDLLYLAQSAAVIGSELSAIACRDFFAENQLDLQQSDMADFRLFAAGNVQIWQGDFFLLKPEQVASCRRVYDRAALIALPESMRRDYVRQLRALLPAADMLLLSLEYPAAEKAGPPFSVTPQEISTLFEFATVTLLQQQDLTGRGFARRRFETSSLVETCWRIQWN
jgi:thiopurine S-methyltransferase